ncbi:winged helix-turn-helix domain-containing protein [Amycolatopsis dongchuanensis]|uniref:winged helix-turn-helix domain-containing protein n=1 Tax=Amycolatopsis dongchuanensis TaxID=1070866 RepID=UPI003D158EB1
MDERLLETATSQEELHALPRERTSDGQTEGHGRPALDAAAPGYLYEAVAEHLAARILAGELPPNTTLPAEGDLASEYGVSLGTARHATQLLRDRGLVATVKSKGTYVCDLPNSPDLHGGQSPAGIAVDSVDLRGKLAKIFVQRTNTARGTLVQMHIWGGKAVLTDTVLDKLKDTYRQLTAESAPAERQIEVCSP